MNIDDVVTAHLGSLMPSGGPSAAEAVVMLYDNMLRATSACTGAFIVYHNDEMELMEGQMVLQLQRVGRYERWKLLHRDAAKRLHAVMRWDAIIPPPDIYD